MGDGATSERSVSCCGGEETFVQIKRTKRSLDFLVLLCQDKSTYRESEVNEFMYC